MPRRVAAATEGRELGRRGAATEDGAAGHRGHQQPPLSERCAILQRGIPAGAARRRDGRQSRSGWSAATGARESGRARAGRWVPPVAATRRSLFAAAASAPDEGRAAARAASVAMSSVARGGRRPIGSRVLDAAAAAGLVVPLLTTTRRALHGAAARAPNGRCVTTRWSRSRAGSAVGGRQSSPGREAGVSVPPMAATQRVLRAAAARALDGDCADARRSVGRASGGRRPARR